MLPTLMLAMALAALSEAQPVRTVPSVDLDRYAGQWFEIGRYPNRFQESCASEVTAAYERRSDGRIRVVNRCRRADGSLNGVEGVARVVEGSSNSRLKVRFAPAWLSALPMVWGDYWVLGLGDDYQWAVVGSPDRKYLWILGRAPELAAPDRLAVESVIAANGFDLARVRPTRQAGPSGGEAAQ